MPQLPLKQSMQQEAEATIKERGLVAAFVNAIEDDNLEVIKYILETYDQDPNAIAALNIGHVLELAARGGHLSVVEFMLKKYGQDPDVISASGISWALAAAAREGQLLVVELLLKKYGQDPEAIAALHINWAFVWAAGNGQFRVLELLLNTCIKSNNKTVLESAANLSDLKKLAQKENMPPALKQLIGKVTETIKRIELDEVMNTATQQKQALTNKLPALQVATDKKKANNAALAQQLQEQTDSVLSSFELGGQ